MRRITKETMLKYNLHRMIDQYVEVYERLNGGLPLNHNVQ